MAKSRQQISMSIRIGGGGFFSAFISDRSLMERFTALAAAAPADETLGSSVPSDRASVGASDALSLHVPTEPLSAVRCKRRDSALDSLRSVGSGGTGEEFGLSLAQKPGGLALDPLLAAAKLPTLQAPCNRAPPSMAIETSQLSPSGGPGLALRVPSAPCNDDELHSLINWSSVGNSSSVEPASVPTEAKSLEITCKSRSLSGESPRPPCGLAARMAATPLPPSWAAHVGLALALRVCTARTVSCSWLHKR
mmetsp:Transcript_3150/g.9185  ORF Transcript_3150/g.9185 Transcript_3150/m.9185 type:complete len:251 (-) Transcript_3150:1949-2701(-)